MAIANNDGRFIGKKGDTVYYMLRGQYVSRTIGKSKRPPTEKQLANFHAMSVTMDFVRVINYFIKVSFAFEAAGTTKNQHNLATSYIKKHALTGNYPNMRIDYSKVVLSNGDVPVPKHHGITKTDGGVLVNWQTDQETNSRNRSDIVMILLYYPGKASCSPIFNAAQRYEGQVFIPAEKGFADEPVEAYMCFRSSDGTSISNSIYLGNLNGMHTTVQEVKNQEIQVQQKAHFDVIEAKYKKILEESEGVIPDNKSFKVLQTEYFALLNKIKQQPPKPE